MVDYQVDVKQHASIDKSGEIVYFELNNWYAGEDYPDAEPFISWMRNDLSIAFRDEQFVTNNNLCVSWGFYDMSQNFCITATKDWVLSNCPELLTKYTKFLRYPDVEDDGLVYGRFDKQFLQYSEENIGIHYDDSYDDYLYDDQQVDDQE